MRSLRLALCVACVLASPAAAGAQSPDVRLTYLGNAGWEITDGRVVVLVDPYLSRLRNNRRPAPPGDTRKEVRFETDFLVPDTATINERVGRADYILITHGHFDHMMDAPYIALRTGAKLIGHETAANLASAYGVPDSAVITVQGGEDYQFESFSLRVIPNLHTVTSYRFPLRGRAPRGLKAPLRYADFVEGGNLAYLVRLGAHQVLFFGSMNYVERELQGLRPDVAIVGAGATRREIYAYTARLMRTLGNPPLVLPTHWDRSWYPYDTSQADALREVEAFVEEVRTASPDTRVVVPEYFEPLAVTALTRGRQ